MELVQYNEWLSTWVPIALCFSTRASVVTGLSSHPCVSSCLWVNPAQYLFVHWMAAQCKDHDDVIKWKHFLLYWPFVRGIHRSPVNSPHKGQSRGALMFSLICAWINGWVNTGDLRRHRARYMASPRNANPFITYQYNPTHYNRDQ